MKQILLIMLMPLSLAAQNSTDSLKAEYTEIVEVSGTSASALHSKAKKYIATVFKSANDVTQLDDNYTTIAKGNTKVTIKALGVGAAYHVRFTYTIACKEGRYKYSIGDYMLLDWSPGKPEINLNAPNRSTITTKQWASIRNQVAESAGLLIQELKKQMAAQDNW
jgi:hypothetical protein